MLERLAQLHRSNYNYADGAQTTQHLGLAALASVLQAASPQSDSLLRRVAGAAFGQGRAPWCRSPRWSTEEASPSFCAINASITGRVALLHLAINVELHCIASFNTSLLTTPTALHRQPVETSSSCAATMGLSTAAEVNDYMKTRSYVEGYAFSAKDVEVFGKIGFADQKQHHAAACS